MKTSLTAAARIGAAAALAVLTTISWSAPADAATATIVGQGAYLCQSAPKGMPTETYNVTIRMSLSAPTTVTPGQTISLSGSMTMQFPEQAYQEGKSIGETEADGYSDTLSVATTINGKTVDVGANRWQTAPFPWNDPVVISAPISIHAFTVPANASGSLVITLPRNERAAPNLASNNPATVAFNGVATNKTAAGSVSENLGCYLQGTAPSTVGTIPITAAPRAGGASAPAGGSAGKGTRGGTGAQQAAAPAVGGSVAGGPAAGTAAAGTAASNAAPQAGTAPAGDAAPGTTSAGGAPVVDTAASGNADQISPTNAYTAAAAPRSGVFVSTNLLILSGGLICLVAISYAAFTQYRLRMIKKAMDG